MSRFDSYTGHMRYLMTLKFIWTSMKYGLKMITTVVKAECRAFWKNKAAS